MKIAIIGHGKMGKAVEQEAKERGIPVSRILNNINEIKNSNFSDDEIAVEFTAPDVCVENIKILTQKGVSVVCGTTAWYDKMPEISELVSKHNTGLLYAENFSIGVHAFYQIVAEAAKLFNDLSYYDVMVYESHHKNKKDAPSGTAKKVAEIICNNVGRKTQIAVGSFNRILSPEELHISSSRCGHVIGEHKVMFDSEYDSIEVNHFSKGRRGYALGAIKCAEWLYKKKGVFSINDYMSSL
ncbi:MAG: 4-hydroxy-tetrahydrodipicolinate reductase [Rickettsiales bacterium]|nr:4-hydroxy-tetrahydrodipicolinate reductase [Rickettsiales bacterium]